MRWFHIQLIKLCKKTCFKIEIETTFRTQISISSWWKLEHLKLDDLTAWKRPSRWQYTNWSDGFTGVVQWAGAMRQDKEVGRWLGRWDCGHIRAGVRRVRCHGCQRKAHDSHVPVRISIGSPFTFRELRMPSFTVALLLSNLDNYGGVNIRLVLTSATWWSLYLPGAYAASHRIFDVSGGLGDDSHHGHRHQPRA